MRTPDDRDREKLAIKMLQRVTNWDWTNVTTQRVNSTAMAVFDEERRSRHDLAPVREFYLNEIATREPGAFLDGMVGIYIESFETGPDHTRHHGQGPRQASTRPWCATPKLIDALPELFRPDAVPLALARIMREADDAYTRLKSIGLNSTHTSGLAKAAQTIFVDRLAPDLGRGRRVRNYLTG